MHKPSLAFSQPEICARIDALDDAEHDTLAFGVIGFDAETVVRRYNAFESQLAGLGSQRMLGNPCSPRSRRA